MTQANHGPALDDAAFVAAFLRANPRFLADRPDLYRALSPPARIHGEAIADHMAAMLRAERMHAASMAERADGVLAAGRAAAGLTQRVHEAVLALLLTGDTVECIAFELPGLLAVDAASLCLEAYLPGARSLPPRMVEGLLDGRPVVFRAAPEHRALLHGEAAGLAHTDALVRVPGPGAPALLALAARDARALAPSHGTGALAFLGRALAAVLQR